LLRACLIFPQIRYAKAVQEIVKPLVKKKDGRGHPDPAEMLEKTVMVLDTGLSQITERLKLKREIEEKMRLNNVGDDWMLTSDAS